MEWGLDLSAAHSACPGQVTGVSGGNLICSPLVAGTSGLIFPQSMGPKGKWGGNPRIFWDLLPSIGPPSLSHHLKIPKMVPDPSSHNCYSCHFQGSMGGGGMESPPPRCKDTAPACRVNTGLVGAWEVEGCRAPHWCQCTASAGRVRMGGLGQRLKCTALAHGIKAHCLNKTKGHIWQGLITDLGES